LLAGISEGKSVQVRAGTGAGAWLWLQLTATSIPDSSGRPEHVLVMVEDVTLVREAQDKLGEALESQRSANATLEKLDRTKTEFLSIVSHEFRTALTGIQGFSELIRDGGLESDEVRAYGGYIFNDADRVNRLIGDMLDLDRMESGRMSIRTTDVDINEVLSDAIARAGSSPSVEFKADLDPRLPIVVGDRDRLIQVVSNLVNNAVKYSPDGGTVTLSSRSEGDFALVSVRPTPASAYPPTRSATSSSGSGACGAGRRNQSPGLAWASRSLSRSWRCMGERSGLRARSGTVRHFTSLSRWRRRTSRHCSAGMPEPAAPNNKTQITVLVADDNDVAQRLCTRVLEKAGYKVLIAVDGLQAVDVALSQHPAMILMDVAMPGIDGIEAMKRIKAAMPNQPIVIASAHSMASDRERFLAAGADDILSKPFRLADLVAIVGKLTAGK